MTKRLSRLRRTTEAGLLEIGQTLARDTTCRRLARRRQRLAPVLARVIPAAPGAAIRADRDVLRQALQRTAILSNEKYRGIRINVRNNAITVQAHNPEQEEAEEEIEVSYSGDELEVGFNVNYLLDALAAIDGQEVELGLTDSNSSCLIRSPGNSSARYVVMPMRL